MSADELRTRLSRVLRDAYTGRRHAARRILVTPLLVLTLVGLQPQPLTSEARSVGQTGGGMLLTSATISSAQVTCGRASLRTGPAPSYRIAGTAATGVFVTVAAAKPGANYNTKCPGGNLKGSTWYEITAVDGTSTSTLYGFAAVYAPAALFTPVPSPTLSPAPTATPATAPTATTAPVPTLTATLSPSPAPSPSSAAAPTATPTQSSPATTAAPTLVATPTRSPSPTLGPTAPPTRSPSPTPVPTAPPAPTATRTPSPSLSYSFDEEFNGTSVSTVWGTHWSRFGATYAWSRAHDTVANGVLTIKMSKDSLGHWTGGLLDTVGTFSQLYGHFEARIKFDGGYGLWPAFWISQTPQQATHPLEIDAMEVCANPVGANGGNDVTDVHQTVHFADGTQKYNDYRGAGNTSGAWHTYAVDWRAGRLSFYMDGRLGWTYTGANVPSVALPVVLDYAVGGSWCGAPTSATPPTAYMQVDYVRVTR